QLVTSFFFLLPRPPPSSPLFPYTTLFRSAADRRRVRPVAGRPHHAAPGRPPDRADERPGGRPGVRVVVPGRGPDGDAAPADARRSEEHTSELQSQSNLVCRLLLEKKKHKS